LSKKTTVSLGTALDIMHASSLKIRLASALAKDRSVVLISDKVEKADTSGLQLIYAFIKQVESQGNEVSWQKPTDRLFQASEILGLSQALHLVEN
jgi:anti-anti-sigma regulatory factor